MHISEEKNPGVFPFVYITNIVQTCYVINFVVSMTRTDTTWNDANINIICAVTITHYVYEKS